jgi:Trypsin-like peptidase domain/DnaJ domain
MPNPQRTKYDELGIARNATAADIERAYRKYRTQAEMITAAPDRPRDNRMKSAYETLSNPDKRAIYDLLLAAPERKRRSKGAIAATFGVLVLAGAAGAAYLLQPAPPPPPGTLTIDEIARKASLAVNRVDSTDMSGKATPVGIAFAVDDGTVVTTCNGITPMSVLTLFLPPRAVPVKVAQVDEKLGLCKLSASGIGSWPLPVTSAEPHPGDTIYMTKVNAVGEVGLVEAKVKRVVPSPRGKAIETSIAVLPERQGGPVFDARGHVVGVALLQEPGGRGEVVRITPEWAVRPTPVAAPAPVRAAPAPVEAQKPLELKTREEIAEDRRKRIEEAVRKNVE